MPGGRRPGGPKVEKRVETANRRKEALDYRLQGMNCSEIAKLMGVAVSTVSRYISDAIRDIPRENAEELIEIELQRLDKMLEGIYADATHGDTWKIDRALAIMDQRAKYLGLYDYKQPDQSKDARVALLGFLDNVKVVVAEQQGDE